MYLPQSMHSRYTKLISFGKSVIKDKLVCWLEFRTPIPWTISQYHDVNASIQFPCIRLWSSREQSNSGRVLISYLRDLYGKKTPEFDLTYVPIRDVTTGKIQVRPLRWWAKSAPHGWDRVKVSENLGATTVPKVMNQK